MNVTKEQYNSVTTPMQSYVNLTAGYDMPIREWAEMIKEVVGFQGELEFNASRPDGALNKLTDNSKVTSLGWKPKVDLKIGLKRAYEWYIYNCKR
jgi:GDP-L-fucose synthase